MSLYCLEEICEGCKKLKKCECCNHIIGCEDNFEDYVDHYRGICERKEVND